MKFDRRNLAAFGAAERIKRVLVGENDRTKTEALIHALCEFNSDYSQAITAIGFALSADDWDAEGAADDAAKTIMADAERVQQRGDTQNPHARM